ncbi:hypothetical protein [Aestuariibaculum sediminum]|uniref:Heparinase II/III-like protein n=1 Tax=Aestuariibaculum sediminum TaxID=2770637 RepID=A0A8J6PZH1_9FLAO|nr:hypothetical protein [Aestuariibaculum sediminum]MBD0832193.1 hypothetical protein [Aestuariibaculum sediminum]
MNNKVSRCEFIKLGGLTLLGAITTNFAFASSAFKKELKTLDLELLKRLVINNDLKTKSILEGNVLAEIHLLSSFRHLGKDVSIMTAALCNENSKYYNSKFLIEKLNQYLDAMLEVQYEDGTLDAGGNRQSPPDTAFILEYMCAAASVLGQNKLAQLNDSKEKLKTFIINAGEAMATGGVHTPNHRWVISAALANINSLYPEPKYIQRVNQWLAEGIYFTKDGHYSERSGVYSAVINKAFITMARHLDKPELLNYVNQNLMTYYYHTEDNGDLVSVESRRQDQFMTLTVTKFYLQYRYMAIKKENSVFAFMVKFIETLPDFKSAILSNDLVFFMEDELLQNQVPLTANGSNNYEKFFPLTNLVRIKRENTSITLFGGNDKPVMIVSGRSSNPNFLMYRKGDAILKYMRLSTSFFRMGYFSSDGIEKVGNKYVLKETKKADYYQPLQEAYQKPDGDYELSPSLDGRFWNKMDFSSRRTSNVKKQITIIEITENKGALELDFKVDGPPNVEVTIEMCFDQGSQFTGGFKDAEGNYFLDLGEGLLSKGTDSIKIGPGKIGHKNVSKLDSEEYTYHQGTLRTEGTHVYITGFTPFKHKMTLR